ncbi:MAG: hypothetical protein H6698_03930 [Myxococcales bacterium]|nr:hypothetical protein [Myxococcales bacterium]
MCDGVDNDCNGVIDDLPPLSCGTGVCAHTVPACVAGAANTCDPFAGATAERCDAIDHDCDGDPYNGFPVGGACGASSGTCAGSGVYVCSGDGLAVTCDTSSGTAPTEICGNGLDDDCDGLFDENNVTGSLQVVEVAIGDADFDYTRCEIGSGASPRCSAVVFRVTNTGTNPVSASEAVTIYSDDGSVETTLASGIPLGRVVPGGTTEEFVACWRNTVEDEDVDIGVALAGSCTTLAGETGTGDYRLGVCGPEICDGLDNNISGDVDELPEACGGDVTRVCVNDPIVGEWLCVQRLVAESCVETGCPAGELCDGAQCVAGCDSDATCPGSSTCYEGLCVTRTVVPPDAGGSADVEPEVADAEGDSSPPATTSGCASAPGSAGGLLMVGIIGVALVSRRRRSRT